MTQDKADVEKDDDKSTKNVKVSPEKQDGATPDPIAVEALRDEQDRRAIVFAAPFFLMFAAPMFLDMDGDRSFWRMTRHEPGARVLLLALFSWPVCLGLLAFWRGIRRRLPGKGLTGLASTMTSLYTLAGAALTVLVLVFERRSEQSPLVWVAVVVASLAVGSVVRSFFHTGWRRWQFLMAPMVLLATMIVLLIAVAEPRSIERAEQGGWVFLFGTAALLPFVGTTWLRKQDG